MRGRGASGTTLGRAAAWVLVALSGLAVGCDVNSFFDPSRTGYFIDTPTTMPILDRIDVVEPAPQPLGISSRPDLADLEPSALQYRLAPGDVLVLQIFELIAQGQTDVSTRTVDQGGKIRLPTLGEIQAGGLTVIELEDELRRKLEPFIRRPVVSVEIREGRSFEFTIYGSVRNPGLYALNRPNLTVREAIAIAGGIDVSCERIYVLRPVRTPEAPSDEGAVTGGTSGGAPSGTGASPAGTATVGAQRPLAPAPTPAPAPAPDLEDLIQKLAPAPTPSAPAPAPAPPAPAPSAPAPEPPPPPAPLPPPAPSPEPPLSGLASPGALAGPMQPQGAPPVDVDTLAPVRVADNAVVDPVASVRRAPISELSNEGDSFVFDVNAQQWVRIRQGGAAALPPAVSDPAQVASLPGLPLTGAAARAAAGGDLGEAQKAIVGSTRIIEIDVDRMNRGDALQNIVIRPGDTLYCEFPPIGVIYIDGEVARPGTLQFPTAGRPTLSRFIAAAGGLGPLAIPERVDLIRRLPGDREATIRVNLTAIRNRTEPDIYLKRDDHIIIGTNFWATPLAVFRNGFRMTYGFGFLLDRNFGNDVFGAPPVNIVGQ
jgi:protein involved in polysaccharide export with SLBB domain